MVLVKELDGAPSQDIFTVLSIGELQLGVVAMSM